MNHPISIREQILQKLLENLQPVANQFGATLHRNPVVALLREECPALVIHPLEEKVADNKGGVVARQLTVKITALTRDISGADAEKVADQMITAAHASLYKDHNLGGLCQSIKPVDVEWDIEDADAVAVALPAHYAIEYRTKWTDMAVVG